jgi:hypothetical protein
MLGQAVAINVAITSTLCIDNMQFLRSCFGAIGSPDKEQLEFQIKKLMDGCRIGT